MKKINVKLHTCRVEGSLLNLLGYVGILFVMYLCIVDKLLKVTDKVNSVYEENVTKKTIDLYYSLLEILKKARNVFAL